MRFRRNISQCCSAPSPRLPAPRQRSTYRWIFFDGHSEFEDHLVELSEWRNNTISENIAASSKRSKRATSLGIISVKIPDVFGPHFVWNGFVHAAHLPETNTGLWRSPKLGDGVWVEFEAGSTSLPIWTGFWWADGEMPEPKGKLVRSFITTKGHKLLLDDDADEVTLIHAGGPK